MRISVLITSYNADGYISDAIDSALAQTLAPVEVVVVDDGSTDASRSTIERYGDQIVSVFQPNRGQYAAHNTGGSECTGGAVAFMDGDDWFLPTKLERVAEALALHPDAGACFHPRILAPDDAPEERPALSQSGLVNFTSHARRARMPSIATTTSGMTIRRSVLGSILPLPTDLRIAADDHILKWAVLAETAVVFIDEFLAVQRIHGRNYSNAYDDPAAAGTYTIIRATLVRDRYPHLALWADRIFAEGLAQWRVAGGDDAPTRHLISDYQNSLAIPRRAAIGSFRLVSEMAERASGRRRDMTRKRSMG